MNGKVYSEGTLSSLIDAVRQYVDAIPLRQSIIAKCHQELGLIVASAPVNQQEGITLTDQEAEAMRKAIQRWRRDKKQSRAKT